MPKVKLSVSVSDEHRHRFADVVKSIKKAGMKVEQELGTIGIVTGSIDEGKMARLRDVKGVSAVEQQRNVQIAPPDSEVQ